MKNLVCLLACFAICGCASVPPHFVVGVAVVLTAPTPGCETIAELSRLEDERARHPDEVHLGKWPSDLACRLASPGSGRVLEVAETTDSKHPLVRLELSEPPPLWFYTGDFGSR